MKNNCLNQIYYITSILINKNDKKAGTSFLFLLTVDGKDYPLLITNSHVIGYRKELDYQIKLHTDKTDSKTIDVEKGIWYLHPNEDLAFTFINPIIQNKIIDKGEKLNNFFLKESDIIQNNELELIDSVEDVLMIGYPKAVYDSTNNLPVIRKGITASMIDKDYLGKKEGLLDISIFDGSSGSPVFINKKYVNRQLRLDSDIIKLIGINYSGYHYENGIIEKTSESKLVKQFMNLAVYVKAECILDFKDIIRDLLKNNINHVI